MGPTPCAGGATVYSGPSQRLDRPFISAESHPLRREIVVHGASRIRTAVEVGARSAFEAGLRRLLHLAEFPSNEANGSKIWSRSKVGLDNSLIGYR